MERLNTTTDVLDLREARKRLQLVRPLVAQIMATTQRLQMLPAEGASEYSPDIELERATLEDDFRRTLTAMNSHGAILKDPSIGLIDFFTWRGNDIAYLCWRHDEPDLAWWHGVHEGFSGRKPLDHGEADTQAAS